MRTNGCGLSSQFKNCGDYAAVLLKEVRQSKLK